MNAPRALVLAGTVLACASGGVPDSEIPDALIAITYRTPEEARRNADDYAAGLEREIEQVRPGPEQARPTRAGRADLVASEEDLSELFSSLFGGGDADRDKHRGRLAFLDPRTLEVEVVQAARRGSIPLDWSADRSRLLFAQPLDNAFQVYEFDRSDRTVRAVTHGPMSHTQACYGPRGRIAVAAVDVRGGSEDLRSYIAVSQPGGRGPLVPLSSGPSDHSPACSPTGEGVVFVREEHPPRAELFFTTFEPGGEPRRLSPGRHPSFSPDGEWVAFAAPKGRELRIWRIRPDGSGRAPIGRGSRHEARPAVSPDGRMVAYVAAESRPHRHLYLRRLDGSGDRILFADGDGEYPVW